MAQLSLTEVSKRFGVNRSTIYRAVTTGKISRLNNGLFDLAEVIRVFGEPSSPAQENAPEPTAIDSSTQKLIQHLERELEFYKQQIAQKDNQINHLQTLLEYRPPVADATSEQRSKATHGDTEHVSTETQSVQGSEGDNNTVQRPNAANSNDAKQHGAIVQNVAPETTKRPTIVGRFGRGIKAFLK